MSSEAIVRTWPGQDRVLQDLSGLGFHRATVLGCSHPEEVADAIVEVPDGDRRHC
jgi:hypothetical protein